VVATNAKELKEVAEYTPEDYGGCKEWDGGAFTSGYGSVYYEGKARRAHRLVYEFFSGDMIPKALCVLHKCDNPICVNPFHLFLGTHKENMEDKVKKGRQYTGGHSLKLSKEQAKQLVSEYTGVYGNITELAKKYNIARNTVRKYIKRSKEDEMWEPPNGTS